MKHKPSSNNACNHNNAELGELKDRVLINVYAIDFRDHVLK